MLYVNYVVVTLYDPVYHCIFQFFYAAMHPCILPSFSFRKFLIHMHAAVPEVRGHHCTNVCTDKPKVYSDKIECYKTAFLNNVVVSYIAMHAQIKWAF